MTKRDLMAKLFTKEQLRNIDASIPIDAEVDNQYWFVMDYNDSNVFGKLVDMRELAKENEINIEN